MQKNKIIFIITGFIAFILLLAIILYYNIPRITYKYNDEIKGYEVYRVFGNSKTYEIKDKYKNIDVLQIGSRAFYNHSRLERVILPDTIKKIERLAFSECANLKEINLENIDYIERNAFSYCKSLASIEIYASYIGASTFYGCEGLEEVILHNTISIGSMAFSKTNIKTIDLPITVVDIGINAFYGIKLEKIIIHNDFLLNNEYLKTFSCVVLQ